MPEITFDIDKNEIIDIFEEIDKVVGRIAIALLQRAKENIIKMDVIAKGELYRSGRAYKESDGEWIVEFDVSYAAIVEFGRNPSEKMPPVDKIKEWLMVKFGYSEKEAKGRAWAIAKKIQKEGYLPRPFMRKAIEDIHNDSSIVKAEIL